MLSQYNIPMSVEDFEKYIKLLEEEDRFQSKLYEVSKYSISLCDMSATAPALVDLLEHIFYDKSNQWISYFCYELDYGREYHDGCVTDKDNNIIKLATARDLYAVLVDNMKEGKNTMKIKVKYHCNDIEHMQQTENGDWIDLRAAERVEMKAGDFRIISLGISVKLPDGYEAHIVPRSSTFKRWGILQTNHMGIIDNSYSGENDIWGFPALAMHDTIIEKGDRICQFRIEKKMEKISFHEVDHMDGEDRGGFGSTGVN